MILDEQIEADFKRYGTLSVSYLMRKYKMTYKQSKEILTKFAKLNIDTLSVIEIDYETARN